MHLLNHLWRQFEATADDLDLDVVALLRLVCLTYGRRLACTLRLSQLLAPEGLSICLRDLIYRVDSLLFTTNSAYTRSTGLENILAVDELLVGFSCLLLHDQGGQRVQYVLVKLRLTHSEKLCSVDAT